MCSLFHDWPLMRNWRSFLCHLFSAVIASIPHLSAIQLFSCWFVRAAPRRGRACISSAVRTSKWDRFNCSYQYLIQVIPLCFCKQSSASLMTSLSTCLHISGRVHKRWHQASCIALHNKSKQVLILTVRWCCDFHSVSTTQIERKEPVNEQINRFNQFLHNLRRRDWEYREAERQREIRFIRPRLFFRTKYLQPGLQSGTVLSSSALYVLISFRRWDWNCVCVFHSERHV